MRSRRGSCGFTAPAHSLCGEPRVPSISFENAASSTALPDRSDPSPTSPSLISSAVSLRDLMVARIGASCTGRKYGLRTCTFVQVLPPHARRTPSVGEPEETQSSFVTFEARQGATTSPQGSNASGAHLFYEPRRSETGRRSYRFSLTGAANRKAAVRRRRGRGARRGQG